MQKEDVPPPVPTEAPIQAEGRPVKEHPQWWKLLLELCVHVWVGSFLFAIIFAPAIALDWAMGTLREHAQLSAVSDWILVVTKYIVAVIDALLFMAFIGRMSWIFLRGLFHEHD